MERPEFSRRYNETFQFLCAFGWAGAEQVYDDQRIVKGKWVANSYSPESFPQFQQEMREILALVPFPWQIISDYANRHFETEQDCRAWFEKIVGMIEAQFAGDGLQGQATSSQ